MFADLTLSRCVFHEQKTKACEMMNSVSKNRSSFANNLFVSMSFTIIMNEQRKFFSNYYRRRSIVYSDT